MKTTEVLKAKVCEYLATKGDKLLLTSGCKSYTASELLKEVNNDTRVGQAFVNNLVILALDLLVRGKEKLPGNGL